MWWDKPDNDESPSGEFVYLPSDESDSSSLDSDPEFQPALNKFAQSSSSSDSEAEANLGGFEIPKFISPAIKQQLAILPLIRGCSNCIKQLSLNQATQYSN